MKLLYIHQYFATNEGTTGTRSFDVSRHLVALGHEVTVITGWSPQSGLRRPTRPMERVFVDGVDVVVCNVAYSNHHNVRQRLASWAGFAGLATVAALVEPGADLIFATSTPPTVGLPARVAASLRRIPYVFEVRDLWPEDLLAAGRLEPGLHDGAPARPELHALLPRSVALEPHGEVILPRPQGPRQGGDRVEFSSI